MKKIILSCAFLIKANVVLASDSYRYMHVSIDTPWAIFIFLLIIVLFPFVLSAVLYWYFTIKKHKEEEQKIQDPENSIEKNNS